MARTKDTRTPAEIKRAKERDRRRKARDAQDDEFGGKGGPPTAAPDDENPLLGVQPGYSIPGQRRGRVTGPEGAIADYFNGTRYPRYRQADLDAPKTQQWDGDRIAQMQQELIAAGLLSKKGYKLGKYDEPTRAAYKNLLEYANQSGIDAASALREYASTPTVGGDGGSERQPFVAEPLNPLDIKDVIAKTAPDVLGRNLSEDEQNAVVAAYNSILVGAQKTAYNANETGGTAPQPPSVAAFTAQRAKELHPEEADQYGLIQQGKVLYSMIGDFQGGKEF